MTEERGACGPFFGSNWLIWLIIILLIICLFCPGVFGGFGCGFKE
jgi:hypothetical protein